MGSNDLGWPRPVHRPVPVPSRPSRPTSLRNRNPDVTKNPLCMAPRHGNIYVGGDHTTVREMEMREQYLGYQAEHGHLHCDFCSTEYTIGNRDDDWLNACES